MSEVVRPGILDLPFAVDRGHLLEPDYVPAAFAMVLRRNGASSDRSSVRQYLSIFKNAACLCIKDVISSHLPSDLIASLHVWNRNPSKHGGAFAPRESGFDSSKRRLWKELQ